MLGGRRQTRSRYFASEIMSEERFPLVLAYGGHAEVVEALRNFWAYSAGPARATSCPVQTVFPHEQKRLTAIQVSSCSGKGNSDGEKLIM